LKINKTLSILLFLVFNSIAFSQSARLRGIILDTNNLPVANVNIVCAGQTTQTNENGFYVITVPANQKATVILTHTSLKKITVVVTLKQDEEQELNMVMNDQSEQLGEVVVIAKNRKRAQGIVNIEPETIRKIPGAMPGVENLLKSLPGVSGTNELSTAYSVRGGNYDENLVYVNDIEVYRPFLIRSGQQEGLSFTNTDLVQNVEFSAGGFQAKFGDKLSSVLDITYRKPKEFAAVLEASLVGGSLAVDVVSKNKKWSAITGVRYRNNSLLVKSQDTETNFKPSFVDVQTNVNFQASEKLQFSFLGNISQNKYDYQPLTRQTNFGTIGTATALTVAYEGQEKDKYTTYFGAFKTTYKPSDSFTLKFISSLFHTLEQEHFDIFGQYGLGEVNTDIGSKDLGKVTFTRTIGSQLDHGRNDLDALIFNTELKGLHDIKKSQLEWGIKYTRESIRDRLVEWQVIDSAGFSVNAPKFKFRNDQPDTPYTGPLVPFKNARATNFNTISRFSGYAQWSLKSTWGSSEIWYNAGIRMYNWEVVGDKFTSYSKTVFTPRAQFAIKPHWDMDMLFRISGGIYHQPPFYRELRDADGVVQPTVKSQKSTHLVLSNDYSFQMWQRPFKLVTELYYKSMTDVNTFTIDNVRTRYAANNNAIAYAQGLDVRLNGEFVPGTESWLSFGYLKTEENIADKGYIARPTDQRLKFGMLFQDYMPRIPSVKLYLNLVYNTGLPGGSPSYSDPYLFQNRLRDYRRADVGFSKVFIDSNTKKINSGMFKNFKELAIGLEIFNLFNNQNAITNTWVQDISSGLELGIPNYLTTRVFNVKLNVKF
jgi:CarboxypepD_reg-like domain/TonB-dependent Receptor Plug Domain